MTDHIPVRIIETDQTVFPLPDRTDHGIGDLSGLHPGSLLEGHAVGRYFYIGFQFLVEFAAPVAVPEIGDVTILLRFAAGILGHAGSGEPFSHRPAYGGRGDKILFRDVQVSVVFHHARVLDLRHPDAVEFVEIFPLECTADLYGPVTPEVEENDRIAVLYGSRGFSVLLDHECGEELIRDAGFFLPES